MFFNVSSNGGAISSNNTYAEDLTITDATIAGSGVSSSDGGGGITGDAILNGTIVAANGTQPDLSGTFIGDNNLIDDSSYSQLQGSTAAISEREKLIAAASKMEEDRKFTMSMWQDQQG